MYLPARSPSESSQQILLPKKLFQLGPPQAWTTRSKEIESERNLLPFPCPISLKTMRHLLILALACALLQLGKFALKEPS